MPSSSSDLPSIATNNLFGSTAAAVVSESESTNADYTRLRSKTSIMTATIFFTLATAALFQSLSVFAQTTMSPSASSPDEEVVHYGPGYQDPTSEYDVPYGLQQILASNSSDWRYRTDFTRDIVPVG